jgi:hypothetical protein
MLFGHIVVIIVVVISLVVKKSSHISLLTCGLYENKNIYSSFVKNCLILRSLAEVSKPCANS